MKEEKKPARGSKIYKKRSYWRGWDNVKIFGFDFHARVFLISAAVIIIFVLAGTMFQEQTAEILVNAHHWVVTRFYWWFMTAANIILLFCLLLMVSPLAKVRLGGRDAKPDYSYVSWFAMIFAASVSVGFLFFGVVEPVYHFQNPPLGVDPSDTETAFAIGMAGAIFHWGLQDGRYSPSWVCPWPCSPTIWACRFPSARCSIPSSATACGAGPVI